MLNRVVLVGRLTKDPELRYTPNGVAVANFTIAVNRPFNNQNGEKDADFINCVVWRRAAENVSNFMKKGSMVGVDGRLQSRSFDDSQGKRQFVTEVVADQVQFLETRDGNKNSSHQNNGYDSNYNQQGYRNPTPNNGDYQIKDEDLPF